MRIEDITLYRADLPLTRPYRLSYRTFESFEPTLVRLRTGWWPEVDPERLAAHCRAEEQIAGGTSATRQA